MVGRRWNAAMTATGFVGLSSLRKILLALSATTALALAGCETVGGVGGSPSRGDIEDSQTASTDIASLSDVVEKNRNDSEAWNMRGSAYARSGQYDLAIKDFNQALTLNPSFAQARSNRALV
jgi:tetratricopeptide (TPR) repeat protein